MTKPLHFSHQWKLFLSTKLMKKLSFFYFHIDIKKYFVCCIKISCWFFVFLAATHICNKTWNVFLYIWNIWDKWLLKLNTFFSTNIDYYRILLSIKLAHKCGTSFISHWNMYLAAGVTSTKAKFLFFFQPSLVPEYYNSGFLGPSKVLIKTHGLQTRPRHNRLRKFNSVKNSLYSI